MLTAADQRPQQADESEDGSVVPVVVGVLVAVLAVLGLIGAVLLIRKKQDSQLEKKLSNRIHIESRHP